MDINRTSYYYKSKDMPKYDLYLANKINDIATRFPGCDYRRITAQLKRYDIHINHKKVLTIMRQENILVKARKSSKATTNSAHSLAKYPKI